MSRRAFIGAVLGGLGVVAGLTVMPEGSFWREIMAAVIFIAVGVEAAHRG